MKCEGGWGGESEVRVKGEGEEGEEGEEAGSHSTDELQLL